MAKNIPPERAVEYIKTILLELDHLGGHARLKELFPRAEANLKLNDYEREPYAKSGFIRWQAIVHFNSIPFVKAGYIQKSGGKWHLTDLGKAVIKIGDRIAQFGNQQVSAMENCATGPRGTRTRRTAARIATDFI